MLNGSKDEKQFNSQQNEFQQLLKSRENVVDFLSANPHLSDQLYERAAKALTDKLEYASLSDREALLHELNLHVHDVAYQDSDKKVVHLRHISRLLPEFFASLTDSQCQAIIELYVTGVHITSVPENIARLTNLKILNLNSNDLTVLPITLGDMPSLTSLNLSDNLLTDITPAVRAPKLHWLSVTNNRISAERSEEISQQLRHRDVTYVDDTQRPKFQ